ncbi:MAG TPA: CbiX/SirB N-terminal domain-containing protein [Noviherbaspirillum sp.]|nr:CbiX/SirB N-terminal domain-containing protein [Noviherbaspirillum sp.]
MSVPQRALVLFAHGARDPRWAEPFQKLQERVQAARPDAVVATAFLELMSPSLPELAADLANKGCMDVTIVPVFFGQGGHIRRDLPLLVDRLRADHPQVRFHVTGAVGEDAAVLDALARYCADALGRA